MAEVRKKVVEDTYNTSKIKVKEKSSKKKETKKNEKKVVTKKKEEKRGFFEKFRIFCGGVKSEFLKVHWTSKSDMLKYSIAVIFFIIFCSLFFYLIYVLFALVQSLFV
ncbi:MAG: preprotein translocase subunit SecE [Bacilli bacterium]|nr:preprotein translocase subunit SecE [Bacilli bacterium]